MVQGSLGAWSKADDLAGDSDIPIDLLPPMIVLDDPANRFFAHLFDPEDPERSLGSGARFLGAQIAVTNEPVSHDIEAILPWLADPAMPLAAAPYRASGLAHWHF